MLERKFCRFLPDFYLTPARFGSLCQTIA